MPRRNLHGSGGLVFHVMNRGARKAPLFLSTADFEAFLAVLRKSFERTPIRILALSLMTNHWHMVLWPRTDTDLTRFVGWATLTHACRWQRVHDTRGTGPVYQGRFRAIPVEGSSYLETVCNYVRENPVRAGLVPRASDWPWSSASWVAPASPLPISDWPAPRIDDASQMINPSEATNDLDTLRKCVANGAPFGGDGWRAATVVRLGWKSGIRPPGRPPSRRTGGETTPGLV